MVTQHAIQSVTTAINHAHCTGIGVIERGHINCAAVQFHFVIATNGPPAKTADTQKFGLFFRAMLENGGYLAPSQFEAGFMSAAHGENELEITVRAAEQAFRQIRKA